MYNIPLVRKGWPPPGTVRNEPGSGILYAMGKHLCDLSKSVKKNLDRYARLVDRPKHVCTDCGRVANNKKMLCEPKKLPPKAKKTTSPPSS